MNVKEYPVWLNKKLEIPFYGGSAGDTVKKDITWNENKTRIVSARMDVEAKASARTNLDIYLNYSEVVHFHWELWEEGASKTFSGDVTALIKNGTNVFQADFYKDPVNPFGVGATFTVTVLIEYEGEEPSVRPWYERWVVPIAVGSAIALIGGTAIASLRRST